MRENSLIILSRERVTRNSKMDLFMKGSIKRVNQRVLEDGSGRMASYIKDNGLMG